MDLTLETATRKETKMRNQKQDFRDKVYGILLVDNRKVYIAAKAHEDAVNALIDQGNENLWDAKSVANAIQEGFR